MCSSAIFELEEQHGFLHSYGFSWRGRFLCTYSQILNISDLYFLKIMGYSLDTTFLNIVFVEGMEQN